MRTCEISWRIMEEELEGYQAPPEHADYLAWCLERVRRYPTVLEDYWRDANGVNPYCFGAALSQALDSRDVIVTGDGTACVVTFQSVVLKTGQRLFSNSGSASMGYDLPAAIGAWYADTAAKRIVCIAGDGSIMMNLQELQTIVGGGLPIKVFLFNNDGYHSIRQTQQNYFPDNIVGCGPGKRCHLSRFSEARRGIWFSSHTHQISREHEPRDRRRPGRARRAILRGHARQGAGVLAQAQLETSRGRPHGDIRPRGSRAVSQSGRIGGKHADPAGRRLATLSGAMARSAEPNGLLKINGVVRDGGPPPAPRG